MLAERLAGIEILVVDAANDNGAMRSMVENSVREALNPVDQWRGIERLVALGWTEDEAVEYMNITGRQPLQRSRSEVRRYITLPGQATGYKIGMLKIMEERRKAEKALAAIRHLLAPHAVVLRDGRPD